MFTIKTMLNNAVFLFKSSSFNLAKLIIVGVSQKSMYQIIKHQESTGSVNPRRKSKCGGKRKNIPKECTILFRKSKKVSRKTSFDLQKNSVLTGVCISPSTVRRRLLEAGRKAKKPLKKGFFTKKK